MAQLSYKTKQLEIVGFDRINLHRDSHAIAIALNERQTERETDPFTSKIYIFAQSETGDILELERRSFGDSSLLHTASLGQGVEGTRISATLCSGNLYVFYQHLDGGVRLYYRRSPRVSESSSTWNQGEYLKDDLLSSIHASHFTKCMIHSVRLDIFAPRRIPLDALCWQSQSSSQLHLFFAFEDELISQQIDISRAPTVYANPVVRKTGLKTNITSISGLLATPRHQDGTLRAHMHFTAPETQSSSRTAALFESTFHVGRKHDGEWLTKPMPVNKLQLHEGRPT